MKSGARKATLILALLFAAMAVGPASSYAEEAEEANDDSAVAETVNTDAVSQPQPTEVVSLKETEDDSGTGIAPVANGAHETLSVGVISWRDLPFQTVKRQTFDYSCGSAAVATLLTYVYGERTTEDTVFKTMFEGGNKDKIRREGFSLLDMSNYLNGRGYKAVGYKLGFDAIEKGRVPFIALINNEGYNHFVVVKSLGGGYVLVGDPNKGNTIYSRDDFAHVWNGIALVITNHASKARTIFVDAREWRYAHPKAIPSRGETPGLDSPGMTFSSWQIAPVGFDMLTTINNVTTAAVPVGTNLTGGIP